MTRTPSSTSVLADIARLDEVIDRESLTEMCRSFFDLFGISLRVLTGQGSLVADVHDEHGICKYVNSLHGGRIACTVTVGQVKQLLPDESEIQHPCFTGAIYRVVPIEYQGRVVGRFVLGPYMPAERTAVPRALLAIDPGVDAERAREELATMPRAREDTANKLARHLKHTMELILFSSHQAHLTSEMHVASVRESYRELAEKTSQLQKAYERLQELDRLKSNFLATVSHELRTPLTSIIGYAEMLASDMAGALNEEQREFTDTIRKKGDDLLALITRLLDLSKLEQGHLKLQKEPIDPAEILAEIVTTVAPMARRKGIFLTTDVEEDVGGVEADPVRIKQVLFNLVENAVKFTPKNGRVALRARAIEIADSKGDGIGIVLMATPRRGVEFAVEDSGIGIPEDAQSRVFDAFYQVDSSSTREHGGAGLGLSIVKRLVDAHAGIVRLESKVGHGTTFYLVLPELERK